MKSRIRYILILTFLYSLSFKAFASGKPGPNIVFIIADDIGWNDIGCYGNPIVKTPNIDKLSAEGIQFNNAFLTASSCSPSRCSIISGKYPHSNGAAELHTPLPESEIPFPLLLKQNGYYTAQAGKWHLGNFAHRAFDRYTDKNGYDNGNGGENNWVRFLRERPKDKPFFVWFASNDAHRPWGADTFQLLVQPDEIQVPLYFVDTEESRRDMASYYNEIARFDYYVGQVRDELQRQGVLENTVIIVMSDNGRPFPRCKTRVYDSGMKTPFVVYWPRQITKGGARTESLISAVDIAPTILDMAGIEAPGEYQGKSFKPVLSQPDSAIRTEIFAEHNWHDYEAHERMVRTKKYLYILNSRPLLTNCGPADSKKSPTQHALNRARDEGKLTAAQTDIFIAPRPVEELYAVVNDPFQLLNLASVPEYQSILSEMRTLLNYWRINTGDTTPDHLTPDWYDRETGAPLEMERKRGTMPGVVE